MPDISTLPKLINYFESIPGNKWCTYSLDNGKGQHCAVGHIGLIDLQWAAINSRLKAIGVDMDILIHVNNGYLLPNGQRNSASLSIMYARQEVGQPVKDRVLDYLTNYVQPQDYAVQG